MVSVPLRGRVQLIATATSLLLSWLWSATATAATCPDYAYTQLSPAASAQQATVTFEAGLLRPQLEAFLRQQLEIKWIDWQVSPHYLWPSTFRLVAADSHQLLARILEPYQFSITIFPNQAAVVAYRKPMRGQS